MEKQRFDTLVIGAGPGGYVAAIRCAQLGMKTAVIEKEHIGGICLNWGCIPTKVLLKNAHLLDEMNHASTFGIKVGKPEVDFPKFINRSRDTANRLSKGVAYLFKKYEIQSIDGIATLTGKNSIQVKKEDTVTHELEAANLIIATGARPKSLPDLPFDQKRILTSKEAMSLDTIPKSMAIIGAGAIGVEFAQIYHTLGTEVSLIEALPTLLPIEDEEISATLKKSFTKRKMKVYTNAMVSNVDTSNEEVLNIRFTTETAKGKEEKELQAEKLLVAIGVQANSENLGIEELGIQTDRGFIQVDKSTYQTAVSNIYAIGDVIGPPMLAHIASAEGVYLAEKLAGKNPEPINYNQVPGCTYCSPQVASIGMTESQAKENNKEIQVGHFYFRANGKALALGDYDGFIKTIVDKKYGEILGVHMIGPEVTELLAEASLAMRVEATYKDILSAIHPHPTLSEAFMEAIGEAVGESTAS